MDIEIADNHQCWHCRCPLVDKKQVSACPEGGLLQSRLGQVNKEGDDLGEDFAISQIDQWSMWSGGGFMR